MKAQQVHHMVLLVYKLAFRRQTYTLLVHRWYKNMSLVRESGMLVTLPSGAATSKVGQHVILSTCVCFVDTDFVRVTTTIIHFVILWP